MMRRRACDPITDLRTDTRAYVTLQALADYFAVDRRLLVKCVLANKLKVRMIGGTEWRVKVVDAIAFEESQLHPDSRARTPRRVLPGTT